MKKLKYFVFVIGIMFVVAACDCDSKSDTWSDEQEKAWKAKCIKMFNTNENLEGPVEDLCDCMFRKTSEKYTPEEAKDITPEEEQKLLEKCSDSW